MSTRVSDSIMDKRVYSGCVIFVHGRKTLVDFIELDVIDFDMLLGIDWLCLCYVFLDRCTRKVSFHFLDEPVIE